MNSPAISLEEILRLAPDTSVIERANRLLSRKKWPVLEYSAAGIWGECRSSGTLRYKIAARPDQQLFFSNSPSPVKPDKYIIALLLKWYEEPEAFRQAQQTPDWVVDGLARAAAASADEPKKSEVPASVQSREKRIAAMIEGAQELRNWLLDVARQGLTTLQMQDAQSWENIAARLTDHKLAGPARRIRMMKAAAGDADWPDTFAEHIAGLVLLAEAFLRFDELPSNLQEELLVQGGQNARKEDALQSEAQEDRWFVVQNIRLQEGQLHTQKTWLWGERGQIPALLLEYVWGSEGFSHSWKAGSVFEGQLFFYPAAFPLRALAGEGEIKENQVFPGQGFCSSAMEMARKFSLMVGANPWMSEFPCYLGGVSPVLHEGTPCLLDEEKHLIPLDIPMIDGLSLLGLGIGTTLMVFGLWNGRKLKALAAQKQASEVALFF